MNEKEQVEYDRSTECCNDLREGLEKACKQRDELAEALEEWHRPLVVALSTIPQSAGDEGVFIWSRSSNIESERVGISLGMIKRLLAALKSAGKEV